MVKILSTAATGRLVAKSTVSNSRESEYSSSSSTRTLLNSVTDQYLYRESMQTYGTPSTSSTNTQVRSASEVEPSLQLMNNPMVESRHNLGTPIARAPSSGGPSQPETLPLPLTALALIRKGADLTGQDCEPGGISPLMWLFIPCCHKRWLSDENVRKHWGSRQTEWIKEWWDAHLGFNSKDVEKTVRIWAREFDKAVCCKMPEVDERSKLVEQDSDHADPRLPTREEELLDEEMLSSYRFLQGKSKHVRLPPDVPSEITKQRMDEALARLESRSQQKSYPPKKSKGKEKEKCKQKDTKTGGFFSGLGRN